MFYSLKPSLIFLFLWGAISFTGLAATNTPPAKPAIKGRVIDQQGTPVPYATVAVYMAADSSVVDGITTKADGTFYLEIPKGTYYVTISFISYETTTIPNVVVDKSTVDLGDIILKTNSQALDEVVVQGERTVMELKLDKRVFNIGKDLANQGLNASELLDNLPSVTVDVDGNVALRGSQNVRILINGKPSGLVGTTTEALQQVQGSMIESVEIITNPSARYEAEGDVGIINIILKKEKRRGINGSVDLNAGYPENFGAGVNLNYRKDWINLFTNYNITYRQRPGSGYSYQEFFLEDSTFAYERERNRTRGGWRNNLQLGTDIFFNDKNTLTLSAYYRYSDNNNSSTVIYRDLNEQGAVSRTVERIDKEEELSHDLEASLNYTRTFDKEDQKWTINIQRTYSDDTETADLNEYAINDASYPTIVQTSYNEEDEDFWLLQTDYIHPFAKEGRVETGYRSTFRVIENNFIVEQQQPDGSFEPLPGFDNFFIYNENIHAGYIQAGNKFGQLSVQAGLRGEYTDLSTELVRTNEVNPREYFNLFPSASIGYEFNGRQTVQLSFSRRINRPGFRSLLPFYGFSDSRNFFSGNPNLNPEFTLSYEANYIKYFDNGSFFGSVYYRYRTDVIDRITTVDSTGFTRIFPVNLATENNYGIELTASYRPFKWWNMNGSFNFYRAITEGQYEDLDLFRDTYTWSARMMSKWTVAKKYDIQVSGFYRAPQETTQGRSKGVAAMDFAIARDVLQGKGTLNFRISDVFNSRRWRWEVNTPEYQFESEFQWRARQFMLSFNYRINQKKSRNRNGGNGDYGMDDMGM